MQCTADKTLSSLLETGELCNKEENPNVCGLDWQKWNISPNLIQGAQFDFHKITIKDILREFRKMRIVICGTFHALPDSGINNKCPNQAYNLVCKHMGEKTNKIQELFLIGLWLIKKLSPDDEEAFAECRKIKKHTNSELWGIDLVMHFQPEEIEPQLPLPEYHQKRLLEAAKAKYDSLSEKKQRFIEISKEQEREIAKKRWALRNIILKKISAACDIELDEKVYEYPLVTETRTLPLAT